VPAVPPRLRSSVSVADLHRPCRLIVSSRERSVPSRVRGAVSGIPAVLLRLPRLGRFLPRCAMPLVMAEDAGTDVPGLPRTPSGPTWVSRQGFFGGAIGLRTSTVGRGATDDAGRARTSSIAHPYAAVAGWRRTATVATGPPQRRGVCVGCCVAASSRPSATLPYRPPWHVCPYCVPHATGTCYP